MPAEQITGSPEEVLPILRRVPLFEGLADVDLLRIAEASRAVTSDPGEVLYEEGDRADAFFVVVDGAVEVHGSDEAGAPSVLREGRGFGEAALIGDDPRSATARVLERSRLLVIAGDGFRSLVAVDPLVERFLDMFSRVRGGSDGAMESDAVGPDDPAAVSRTIQRGLLPGNAPKVEGYDIAAGTSLEEYGEGRTVWDRIELPDGRTALVSLLVRGDGLPPAHHLGVVRALLRVTAGSEARLTEIFRRTNEAMVGAAVEGIDQQVDCAILVPSERSLTWTAAGRPAAAILRRDGNFEELPSHGPPLGVMEGFRYGSHETPMGTGDVALVLSDASKGLFRGAADLVATLQGKPVGEVVSTVHKALRKAQERVPETTVLYARKA